jgi:hypothetical protein
LTYQEALEAFGRRKAGLPDGEPVQVWVDFNAYDEYVVKIEVSVFKEGAQRSSWVGVYDGSQEGLAAFMSEVMA